MEDFGGSAPELGGRGQNRSGIKKRGSKTYSPHGRITGAETRQRRRDPAQPHTTG